MPAMERMLSFLLRARLWLGKKRFGSLGPSVVRVGELRIIKGPCELVELEGLKYVAQNTSIPVPMVLRTYRVGRHLYIEMEYIQGDNLQAVWSSDVLSPNDKQAIVKQVADYIDQLRLLEPPQKEVVASAELGQCLDYRVGYDLFGPFTSNEEFHSFLRGHIPLNDCSQVYGECVTRCHTRRYRTYFSHGDLCPRNLIVRNGKLVAIVDWQFARWYPEYWEYTKAHFGLLNMPDWYVEFKHAVTRYDDELAAESALGGSSINQEWRNARTSRLLGRASTPWGGIAGMRQYGELLVVLRLQVEFLCLPRGGGNHFHKTFLLHLTCDSVEHPSIASSYLQSVQRLYIEYPVELIDSTVSGVG